MKRTAHYLKQSAGGAIPRSLLSLAAVKGENEVVYHHLCHADLKCEGDGYLDGISGQLNGSLWEILAEHTRQGYPSWLFMMHAVEQLALTGFWDQLEDGHWELGGYDDKTNQANGEAAAAKWNGLCILQDPPTIIVARPSGSARTLKMVDCRNYGVSNFWSLYTGHLPAHDGRIAAAAQANAINVFVRQLAAVVKAAKLGSLKTTAASQAMHAYRHRFMRGIILVHANHDVLALERAAMYAGRCEAWTVNRRVDRLYHLDFNSFYPSVACGESMPARLAGHTMACVPNPKQLATDGFLTISEVTIDAKDPIYPLRFREKLHGPNCYLASDRDFKSRLRDNDVFYPTGRFRTTLCGPELAMAYELEEVRLVHQTAWYEPSELFTGWSSATAEMERWCKDNAVKGVVEFVKRLRNCLFGKWGQWNWTWTAAPWEAAKSEFDCWYGPDPDTGGTARYRSIGGYVQVERNHGESHDSCPAISAWVYSLARRKLWAAIACAGQDNVHYMDADSLWVNHTGFAALDAAGWLDQREPGKLKIEDMHEWVKFHGLKQYEHYGKSVHAGVPSGVPGSYKDGWRYKGPERTMPALLSGRKPCDGEVENIVRPGGGYRHGVVTMGGRTTPHHIRSE